MDLQFKEITIDSVEEMMPFYKMRHTRTCDSVFLESFIWKDFYRVRYAVWEGRALLWLMEYGGKYFSAMPLCRESDLADAFGATRQYFNETLGQPLVINLADEFAVEQLNLPPDRYLVEEQTDSRDYLYSGDSLRSLSGKKLHKKKNRVNAFMRQYESRYEYRKLCCSDSHSVWEFLDKWRERKGDEAEEHLDYEVRGIHDILKNCRELSIHMGGVFIDGQLEAFSMGSFNPVENMAVIHIEKANPEIGGLYQYINQHFLLAEFPDAEWVNREDDLGIEGLRTAKMSYYPADFARKYLVEQLADGSRGQDWAKEIGNTANTGKTDYLPPAEKERTRQLWHSCFPGDSDAFIRYYYQEKTKDNRILATIQDGQVAAMAQLNPYEVVIRGREHRLDYIVGVATEESRRHKGLMGNILKRMLRDMAEDHVPFTFLMPADAAIYLPFDFTYICDIPSWELTEAAEMLTRVTCADTPGDCRKAAEFMENWLAARYDMYCRRDSAYLSRLIKELSSENGRLEFLYDGEELAGLEAFWGLKEAEQRLLYAKAPYARRTGDKPLIMARIANLTNLLEMFRLKGGAAAPAALRLQVQDPIVKENQGEFLWTLSGDGPARVAGAAGPLAGEAAPLAEEAAPLAEEAAPLAEEAAPLAEEAAPLAGPKTPRASAPSLSCTISQLTSWIFGYREPEVIWPEASAETLELLKQVDRVEHILLDEIV